MIPLPVILAELIMALGAALFGANALVFMRTRGTAADERVSEAGESKPRTVARGKILVNMLIGLVVFTWGLATFIVRIRG